MKSERTKEIERQLEESRRKDADLEWAEQQIKIYSPNEIQALYEVIHNHLHGED